MKQLYPKSVRKVILDAPFHYSLLALADYNNGSVGAIELLRRWERDKKNYEK